MSHRVTLILLAALTAPIAHAAPHTIYGKVIGVADGDTLTILDANKAQHKIRLAEIDAPESNGQAFGFRSKQSLSELCYRIPVRIEVQGSDRYGRTIGRVYCNGIDANAEQVRRGLAWVYRQYARDKSLHHLEAEAKGARRGLWGDPDPAPPWEWRRK